MNSVPDACWRSAIYGLPLGFISLLIGSFHGQLRSCRTSISSETLFQLASNNSAPECDAIYEKCRCSFSPNISDKSIDCITDFSSKSIELLTMISTVLQLSTLYELFINSKQYRSIAVGIILITTLPISILFSNNMYTIACPYLVISQVNELSGIFMFGLTNIFLVIELKREKSYFSRMHATYRRREVKFTAG